MRLPIQPIEETPASIDDIKGFLTDHSYPIATMSIIDLRLDDVPFHQAVRWAGKTA
jgi:hypothetical protein